MANEINITMTAKDLASGKIKGVGKSAQSTAEKLRGMRGSFLAVGAAGAAVVGILGAFTKSSLDQQVGINRLDNALKNANTSYAANKNAIEEVIGAIQDKTNFGDEDQRASLTSLLALTGDYTTSLRALGVVTDLAAALGMDLNAASLLLGKALSGNISALSRYGIQLDSSASNTEILAALTAKFGGAAEAASDPVTKLKNRLGDVAQVMGDVLLPIINALLPSVESFAEKFIGFAEANPGLTKTFVILAAVLGTLAIGIAALGLSIPIMAFAYGGLTTAVIAAAGAKALLTTALWGNVAAWIALHAATGGIFLAIAIGVTAIIAGFVLLIKNWDKVFHTLKVGANLIIGILENLINVVLDVYINPFIKALNLLGKVFGFHVDEIDVAFGRIDTTVIDTAAVIKENTASIDMDLRSVAFAVDDLAAGAGDAFRETKWHYSDLTDSISEDAAIQIKAFEDVAQAHSESVTRFIEMSRKAIAETERRANLEAGEREKTKQALADATAHNDRRLIAEWEQQKKQTHRMNEERDTYLEQEEADAKEQTEILAELRREDEKDSERAHQAALDDLDAARTERLRIEEEALAAELELFQFRLDAADALAERNAEAFAAIKMQVSLLPANIQVGGGIAPGGAGVAGMFKASQQNVLNELEAARAALAAGQAGSLGGGTTVAMLQADVARLEGVIETAGFRGERLGGLLYTPGGRPPMLPGMGDDSVTRQVFARSNVTITGDVYGMDDFNSKVNAAFMAGEQLGTTGAI